MRQYYIDSFKTGSFFFQGAWAFANEERTFLVSPHGTTLLIDARNALELIDQRPSDTLAFQLLSHGLASLPTSQPLLPTNTIKPTFFIIDLTKRCNLHCLYCFRDYNQRNDQTISYEEIDRIVHYIANYCDRQSIRKFHIQPWGGEPLLELKKIGYLQDAFIKRGLSPRISIETNATLLTEETARFLHERHIAVGVSIDGDPLTHNLQRPFNSSKGSFTEVVNGIRNLQKAGFSSFGTISVLTSQSIDHISELASYLVKELHIWNLKFNLVRTSEDSPLAVPLEKINTFVEELCESIVRLAEEGYPVSEGNLIERIYNLLLRKERNICKSRGCMGGRKMISFNRSGEIFPCEMTDYSEERIGSITNPDLLGQIQEAVNKSAYFKECRIEQCNTCPWWYYCKGGCHTAIRYKKKNYEGVDDIECRINQKIYPILIDIILNRPYLIEKLTQHKIKLS